MALSKVWVFAEADAGVPSSSTLELLTKAREIGDVVEAVYIGADAAALAGPLGSHGASTIHAADPGDRLVGVVGAAVLAALVGGGAPDLILFAQSYDGRDAIALLSAALDRPVLTNGSDLIVEGDSVAVREAALAHAAKAESVKPPVVRNDLQRDAGAGRNPLFQRHLSDPRGNDGGDDPGLPAAAQRPKRGRLGRGALAKSTRRETGGAKSQSSAYV